MLFASQILKIILAPFSLLYGLIIRFRNFLYDKKYLKSVRFDFPIIAIGNLTVGGTGKTPHTEYLLKLLGSNYKTTVLSRGYKRKSKGYHIATETDDANMLGDEPLLLKKKYPFAEVCVAEDRLFAIPQIINDLPETQVILMDDAFQHRAVSPSLSILLTTYNNPYYNDMLLPAGRLREYSSAAARADFIVVTKCPEDIAAATKQEIIKNIQPEKHQKVFFSYLHYGTPYNLMNPNERLPLHKNQDVYIFCGIANTDELESYVASKVNRSWLRQYSDHHYYDRYDLETISESFNNIESNSKILLTTEKDAARLYEHREWFIQKKLSIFALPVEVRFFEQDQQLFNQEILTYLYTVTNATHGKPDSEN
jgi:tetraacyldisaccharide 4'-kinase